MFLKAFRNGLGFIVVFINWLTQPKPIQRNEADQINAESKVKGLSLYQHRACPFCVKVRREIHRLNVKIELRTLTDPKHRETLEKEGGSIKAPCLRIENENKVNWLYESSDIIDFLNEKISFSDAGKIAN